VQFKVAVIEMNPRILWVLFMDPLGSAEHSLGNTDRVRRLIMGLYLWINLRRCQYLHYIASGGRMNGE
jgi:hypothetical protein